MSKFVSKQKIDADLYIFRASTWVFAAVKKPWRLPTALPRASRDKYVFIDAANILFCSWANPERVKDERLMFRQMYAFRPQLCT